ncbi:hypothetical protein [Heliorestis convoluta]|uniref:Putative membrane protein, tspO n=1 Tax=Heliorestis convoluta TaxID=356322 RepID=A0A5Q2N151_9FIRM|nr:hypothetical protein [Heliorestis convoluta]QGG48728.1 putative membrane protein, tspO [Heliorestis convoluta]
MMRKLLNFLLYWRNFIFLLFYALLAAFSFDLVMSYFRRWLQGESDSLFFALLGLGGLIVGCYGLMRFIYHQDKKRGRLKRQIRWLE